MEISEIKTGDILLSRGHGPVSAGIRATTSSEFSHIAVALKQNYEGGPCLKAFEAIGKGVGSRPFELYLKDRHHDVSVYRLKDPSLLDENRLMFDAFRMEGHDYNTSGIINFFRNRAERSGDKEGLFARFCSEVVSWLYSLQKAHGHALESVYHATGLDPVPEHSDHATSPGDIAKSKLFECIGTIDVPEREEEQEDWEVEG